VSGVYGPDIVIAGSARSGTSSLASRLSSHPCVDPGAIKEPNFFSREANRGLDWYDRLYEPRRPDLLRLDASMSYTFKQFPNALRDLVAESPRAVVIYAVRHPIRRLLSHYQLHRDYFGSDPAQSLGQALAPSGRYVSVYTGASDYAFWLPQLAERVDPSNLIIVPFPVITGSREKLAEMLCAATGLAEEPLRQQTAATDEHRNHVVQFRGGGVRKLRRVVRRAGLYPTVRRTLGADRLRRLRSLATRQAETENLTDALATCSADQLDQLRTLYESARTSTAEALALQDSRLGLQWARDWHIECPEIAAGSEARW